MSHPRILKAVLPLLCLGAASASAFTVRLAGDSYTGAQNNGGTSTANNNFGTNANAYVRGGVTNQRAWLKFDLASLPTGTTWDRIEKANLRVFVTQQPLGTPLFTAGTVSVSAALASWSEGVITHSNAPAVSSTVYASKTISTADQFVEFDLTELVRDWLDTDPANHINNEGIVIYVASGNTAAMAVKTKEADDNSQEAQLIIQLAGQAGTPGTKWLTGTTAPAANIGSDGDFYLNTATSQYYTKVSGAWNTPVSLQGASGTNGSKWLSGSGAPTAGVGVNGDFYLDTTNSVYYGPKASGVWPGSGTSIKGATGAQGPATIRIQQSGDLSMGQFQSGPTP